MAGSTAGRRATFPDVTSLADEVLRAGLDDWVPLAALDGHARLLWPDADWSRRRGELLDALRQLLDAGLVELGEVDAGRFRPWPAASTAELVDRVRATMSTPGAAQPTGQGAVQHAEWAFAIWLSTTQRGDDAGYALIERESCMDDGRALAARRQA